MNSVGNSYYNSQSQSQSQNVVRQDNSSFQNAQNVEVENPFSNNEQFPVIWKQDLPNHIFDVEGEQPFTFTDFEVVVHQVKSAKNTSVAPLIKDAHLHCARSTELSEYYIQNSVKGCRALIVVYGIPIKVGMTKTHKVPLGFTTLQYPNDYVQDSNDSGLTHKQYLVQGQKVTIRNPIYIDVMCSRLESSGLGEIMIKALENPQLRTAFAQTLRIKYDGISLRALPSAYPYFIYKCDFIRTNGSGLIWPFADMRQLNNVKNKWFSFYEKADVDASLFPSKWSLGYVNGKMSDVTISSSKEFYKYLKPTFVFEGDGMDNGYFCMKPLKPFEPVLSGGHKHKATSQYVSYSGHKRKYKIYLDGRKKCIHVQGKCLYLSSIRGKYTIIM
jgi:hypothetical protein